MKYPHITKIYIFLLFLLLAKINSISPNCQLIAAQNLQLLPYDTELQVLNISKYFKGYNLNYDVTPKLDQVILINPLYLNDVLDLTRPVKNLKRIAGDVLRDINQQWLNVGASLLTQDTTSFTVTRGQITQNANIKFNDFDQITIKHKDPTNCFGMGLIDQTHILVDCQIVGSNVDTFYVLEAGNQNPYIFKSEDSIIQVTNRKSLLLRRANDLFLFSAAITPVNTLFNDQTFITVFRISDDWHPQYVLTIDAALLGISKLTISDFTIDTQNRIHIIDLNQGLIQFEYLSSNQITQPLITNVGSEKSLRITTFIDADQNLVAQVLTESAIKQFKWPNGIVKTYQIPFELTNVKSFKMNDLIISLQSQNKIYLYKRGQTKLKHLLYQTDNNNLIVILNPKTPQAILLGNQKSQSYLVSQGFLQISVPNDPQDLTLTATSTSSAHPPVQCSIQIKITPVADPTQVYAVNTFPSLSSIESPQTFTINVQDYFLGSNLKYDFPTTPSYSTQASIIADIPISAIQDGAPQFLATYNYDDNLYYRISKKNKTVAMNFQACTLKGTMVNCQQYKIIMINRNILFSSIFEVIDNGNRIGVLGLIYQESSQWVNFTAINDNKQYPSRKFTQIKTDVFPITDIDININFIFVTVRSQKAVYIYANNLEDYPLITVATKTNVKITNFYYPRQVDLSPYDPNIFFIKNLNSIIIIKIYSSGIEAISMIDVPKGQVEKWGLVINRLNLVIILPQTQNSDPLFIEYAIYNIYKPLLLKTITIQHKISLPLYVYNTPGSNYLFIKVIGNDGNCYLDVMKLGRPTLGSSIVTLPFDLSGRLVGANFQGGNFIQTAGLSNTLSWNSRHFFNNPSISIIPKVNPNMKFDLVYQFKISTQTNNISISSKLNVYNYVYQVNIKNVSNQNPIQLPKVADHILIDIDTKKWFDGPASAYTITCPLCNNNDIVLNNRAFQLNTMRSGITNANSYIYAAGRLWVLANQAIYQTDLNDILLAPPVFLNIPAQFDCPSFGLLADEPILLVYCRSLTQQWLIPLSIQSQQSVVVLAPIPIDTQNFLEDISRIESVGSRVYLLDNNIYGDGVGQILVFKYGYNEQGFIINYDYTITENSFGAEIQSPITDFKFFMIPNSPWLALMVILKQIGVGYSIVNPAADTIITGTLIPIKNNDLFQDYILDKTQFLQILQINTSLNNDNLIYDVIITVTNGQHLYLQVVFTWNSPSAVLKSAAIINTFNKYGNQQVLNWAQALNWNPKIINYLIIGYKTIINNQIRTTLAVYEISNTKQNTPIDFVTSIQQLNTDRVIGLLLQDPATSVITLVKWGRPDDNRNVFYAFWNTFQLLFNYNKKGDFNSIQIKASNIYSSATYNIPIHFEGQSGGKKKFKWYIIVIILIIVAGIVGIGLFYYLRIQKKKKEQKQSLLASQIQGDS